MADMMRDLNWLNIKQRHDLHTAVLTYKIKNDLAPAYLSKLLTDVSDVNMYRKSGPYIRH